MVVSVKLVVHYCVMMEGWSLYGDVLENKVFDFQRCLAPWCICSVVMFVFTLFVFFCLSVCQCHVLVFMSRAFCVDVVESVVVFALCQIHPFSVLTER